MTLDNQAALLVAPVMVGNMSGTRQGADCTWRKT